MPKLSMHTKESAPKESIPLLNAVEKKFGFLPNLMKVLAGSPLAIQAYLNLSEIFEKSAFTPREQQLVLLAISQENRCDYCLAAHSMVARNMVKVPAEEITQVRTGVHLADKKSDALVSFTRLVVKERGFVNEENVKTFLASGYEERHVLEIVTAIALKTISNYANHLAQTPIDPAFS